MKSASHMRVIVMGFALLGFAFGLISACTNENPMKSEGMMEKPMESDTMKSEGMMEKPIKSDTMKSEDMMDKEMK